MARQSPPERRPATLSVGESMLKYLASFFLMVALTALAFYAATVPALAGAPLWFVLLGLASVQVLLQFYTFMHLNERGTMFYNIFIYAGIVVALISVGGILFL